MPATMQDVARLAGVSTKTVSNVINSHPHVSRETREKVERAIQALDYQLNFAARNLRSGRSGVIGLTVPALSVPYFAELADGVIAAAEAHGLAVLIEQTGTIERERAFLRSHRLQHVDGLILNPLDVQTTDSSVLRFPIPIVVLGDQAIGGSTAHISTDHAAAADAATTHLIEGGRRRIAALGVHAGESGGSAGLRFAGYRRALERHGIELDRNLLIEASLWSRPAGAAGIRELFDRRAPFDSVFAFNDTLALGAMRALQDAGLTVPRDVAIVGFDNLEESAYSIPSLTTIDPGKLSIAETAVRLLVEQVRSSTPAAAQRVEPAFRLIERESTAR